MYREFFEEISGGYPIAVPSGIKTVLNKINTCTQSNKLSILVTVAFSALMLRERVSGQYLLGIAGMCAGAILMVIG